MTERKQPWVSDQVRDLEQKTEREPGYYWVTHEWKLADPKPRIAEPHSDGLSWRSFNGSDMMAKDVKVIAGPLRLEDALAAERIRQWWARGNPLESERTLSNFADAIEDSEDMLGPSKDAKELEQLRQRVAELEAKLSAAHTMTKDG